MKSLYDSAEALRSRLEQARETAASFPRESEARLLAMQAIAILTSRLNHAGQDNMTNSSFEVAKTSA